MPAWTRSPSSPGTLATGGRRTITCGSTWTRRAAQRPGLYAYSFAVAYAKTRNPRYREWARGIGSLYWKARNPKTNLTESCLGVGDAVQGLLRLSLKEKPPPRAPRFDWSF